MEGGGKTQRGVDAAAAAALLCSRKAGSVGASEEDSMDHRGWEDEAASDANSSARRSPSRQEILSRHRRFLSSAPCSCR